MHVYDILEDILSEARRVPRTTDNIFQDFSVAEGDDDGDEASLGVPSSLLSPPLQRQSQQQQGKKTPFCVALQSALAAFRNLEQDVERILVRILPLAAVVALPPAENHLRKLTITSTTVPASCIMMNGEDLDILRRYFIFLHFRNSSVYTEMMSKMSFANHNAQPPLPKPESEREQMQVQNNQQQWVLRVRTRRQAFLDEAARFLGLYPNERVHSGIAELERNCWQLCEAQVSFGLAPAQAEYLHTERLFGSLDDAKDGHKVGDDDTHRPIFFFPVSPTTALCVTGGLVNTHGPTPEQFLVRCTRESAAEVHMQNSAMLMWSGSGDSYSGRVYFSSLRAASDSLASIGGNSGLGDGDNKNCWYSRLRERCLVKHVLETTAKKVVLVVGDDDDDDDGEDDTDDTQGTGVHRAGRPHRQLQTGRWRSRRREGNGPSRVVVEDLTERMTLQLWRGPRAYGSLADVYKGELVLLESSDKMHVAIKCVRPHVVKDHMKWLREEVVAWHALQHPHVARLFGLVRLDNECGNGDGGIWLGMVSPWCENGTIIQYLVKNPSADRLRLLIEVASGCSYLHDHSPVVVHGDLRGANILVDADGRAIITDFGLSRVMWEPSSSDNYIGKDGRQNEGQQELQLLTSSSSRYSVAVRWLAPELMRAGPCNGRAPPISTESDVYSFGCLCIEVVTGDMPFAHLRSNCAVILGVLLDGARPSTEAGDDCLGEHVEPHTRRKFWALLDRCWSVQPEKRPLIAEVVRLLCHLCAHS